MGVFEIRLVDVYFSDQHKLSSSNSNQNLFEKFVSMDFFKEIREKYSEIIEPGIGNLENISNIPVQENLPKFRKLMKQEPRFESLLMDTLKVSSENIPSMLKSFYLYDDFLYKHFSKMMESAKEVDKSLLLEIIKVFQELRKSDFSLFQQIQSPLDINEFKTEARLKIQLGNFKFKDLMADQWEIFQNLNQKEKNEQETNVHSWCRVVGELIESQLKRTIYFIFLINKLIIYQKKYVSEYRLKSMSVSKVFKLYYKHYNRYEFLKDIPHIRNSINHSDFTWESSEQIEQSLIHLVDRKWKKTIKFEKLLDFYSKLIHFISTFELVITDTHLSLLDKTRPIDVIWKDVGNQLFQQRKGIIKEWLESDNNK